MDDLVLRLQFDNNNKLIVNVSQGDTTSSLIEKIKSLYALHYSKRIHLGSLKDDKGFEIINDIKISSLFRNGDVLCVFVKEVGDYKSSESNGLINYDYKRENREGSKEASGDASKEYTRDTGKDTKLPLIPNPSISNPPIPNPLISNPLIPNPLIPNPPKNGSLTSLPKTKLPIKEEERSLTMNPITENSKEEKKEEKEIKKPRKRRAVKPKEEDKKIKNEDKKIKNEENKIKNEEDKIKNEVEDPFSVFEDLKKKSSLVDTPSKIQPPVINPIPKDNKKDIKELKKKSKVDYNKVDD